MSIQIQFRRGTTAEHSTFTGAVGEITVDTTKDTAVVHDNSQVGGFALLREDGSNSALSDGSVSAPSIKFSSSTTTGIYSPGANQFGIATNGVGRIAIDASGNIVAGGTLTVGSFIPTSSTVPTNGLYSPGTNQVALSTNGTGRLFIAANGDISLVDNGLYLSKTGLGNGQITFDGSTYSIISNSSSASLILGTNSTERLRITSDGKVGVGTSSPVGNLDVRGLSGTTIIRAVGADTNGNADAEIFSTGTTGNSRLYFSDTAAQSGSIIYSHSNNSFAFATNGSPAVTIDSSQRVGVGTTSPNQLLDVRGNAQVGQTGQNFFNIRSSSGNGQFLFFTESGVADRWLMGSTAGSGDLVFRSGAYDFSTGNERLRIDSSGRLGIGTSAPAVKLTVFDTGTTPGLNTYNGGNSAPITSFTARAGLELIGYQSVNGSPFTKTSALIANSDGTVPSEMQFWTKTSGQSSPAERLRIDSSGRVGIGTTGPTELLSIGFADSSSGKLEFRTSTYSKVAMIEGSHDGGTANGSLRFWTRSAGTESERARIDSSGRLLVGTSSDLSGGDADARLQVNGDAGAQILLSRQDFGALTAGTLIGEVVFRSQASGVKETSALIKCEADATQGSGDKPGRLVFSTTADGASSPTTRITLKSDGRCVFSTAPDTTISRGAGGTPPILTNSSSASTNAGIEIATDSTATRYCQIFTIATSIVGSITTSGSATAYNTSSDYRLKENVTAVTDGITRLQQLKPSRFNFIADPDKTLDGFLAHEVQTVVPEAITGEKDAVDDEGNPQYQGIDQSKLVPLLTAALQEAIAKIENLEQRLSDAGIA